MLLSVADSGSGMESAVIEHIFEPFFTTKELGKGTGLGLSMVHGIVGQHNGFIEVTSKPGEGTTFFIYLPTVDAAPVSVPPISSITKEKVEREDMQSGGESLLVVEDDPDLRFLMEEVLKEYGYRVFTASDGAEGFEIFKEHEHEISLVVADLMTPRMTGKELHDHIRDLDDSIRFLFVSGYTANQISQNFVLDMGFTLLSKPFDFDELAAKTRELLNR